MFIFLGILLGIILYIVGSGVTYGYGKYRWPSEAFHVGSFDDSDKRVFAAFVWPFYWLFIWPFTKAGEETYSHIERQAAMQIAKNKARVADLQATRAQVEATNAELERAEVELEKEIGKL